MNSGAYTKMCEDAAYGSWLVEVIAESLGVTADIATITKAVYKNTACGAWIQFDEQGIMVGTIVEGSDAEYSERIPLSDDEDELCRNFNTALQHCEEFAKELHDTLRGYDE